MKVLVAGGAGYIGSVVTAALVQADHEAVVLDDLSTGHRDAVPDGVSFVESSLSDVSKVLTRDAGFDAVIHLAAKSLVGESEQRPELYWRENVGGAMDLLDAMRAADVRRIVFSSSSATYGNPEVVPIEEDARTEPTSVYGATKLTIDHMLTGEARVHGLAAVSLRYFNAAGAAYGLGERHATETHLIPIALQVVTGAREKLSVYGTDYPTPDGTCIRDYIHVADLAAAHLLTLEVVQPGEHRIYNLGSGSGYSVRDVVAAVREVTGHPVPVEDGPRRPGDPAKLVASSARIAQDVGWAARHGLTDMVSDAYEVLTARLLN
ncbi:MAG: UDP-glucose 4-epimerase GalE [Geodermatophilaceae bacterium]|nr:UDP-glucose 4-epimerase GalE [Geodermatophilaceae bacterium]